MLGHPQQFIGVRALLMAMGRRPAQQQAHLFVATTDLPQSPGHVFYEKLNQLLDEAGFDRHVEGLCQPYYAEDIGRESIPPGVYFRMLLIGYFEGIDSQRGIAWRCSDSLSLRAFLGVPWNEATPDHSSLTKIRQRLPLEVHEQVFLFVLQLAQQKKFLRGKTVAVDATTLEANAAMRAIVRKDTGEDWKEYLKRLMAEEGIQEPTDEEIRRFDKKRKKKVSNKEWESPADPDSRIAKMKDGTTHLAYKAEHVVDVDSEFVVAASVHPADQADPATLVDSILQAQVNLVLAGSEQEIEEAVADKGYHKAETLAECEHWNTRTYIPEPKGREYNWEDKPEAWRKATAANRRRVQGARSKRLQKKRSELVERSFAHVCETGGGRRTWLRGLANVTKRYVVQVAAHNLGLLMRKLLGVGKPRTLQGGGGSSVSIGWCCYWGSVFQVGRRYGRAVRFYALAITQRWHAGLPQSSLFSTVC
jgi:transposase